MSRAKTIPQTAIVRAIKAVHKSGVPMVIEVSRDGSLCILPPELARRGVALTANDLAALDYKDEIVL